MGGGEWIDTDPLGPENLDKLLLVDLAAVVFVVVRHKLLHLIFSWLESQRSQRHEQVPRLNLTCQSAGALSGNYDIGDGTCCMAQQRILKDIKHWQLHTDIPEPSVSRMSNASSISFFCTNGKRCCVSGRSSKIVGEHMPALNANMWENLLLCQSVARRDLRLLGLSLLLSNRRHSIHVLLARFSFFFAFVSSFSTVLQLQAVF